MSVRVEVDVIERRRYVLEVEDVDAARALYSQPVGLVIGQAEGFTPEKVWPALVQRVHVYDDDGRRVTLRNGED